MIRGQAGEDSGNDSENFMGLTVRELYRNSPCGTLNGVPPKAADAAFANPPFGDQQRPEAIPWYALTVKHQHERAIETALVERGFEAFSPMYRSRRQWSDRTKEIELDRKSVV